MKKNRKVKNSILKLVISGKLIDGVDIFNLVLKMNKLEFSILSEIVSNDCKLNKFELLNKDAKEFFLSKCVKIFGKDGSIDFNAQTAIQKRRMDELGSW